MNVPVYNRFYVESKDGDIPVHFPDFSGETDGWEGKLKEVHDLRDLYRPHVTGKEVLKTLYVEVKHPLEYPYARWDCEDTRTSSQENPRRFCVASLVATPKLALI